MKSPLPEADLRAALGGLKDFQRRTVDHVFERMYLDANPARRMLISDEVGLGKTLVARGVIARAIEHLWGKVKRLDVVYICSNGDIARQNVNRLRVLRGDDGGMRLATRLTLLAPQLAALGDVNFIALTPATSFDLKTNLGVASERAMLYWLLRESWEFGNNAGPYNVLRGNAGSDSFRWRVKDSRPAREVLDAVLPSFSKALAADAGLRREFEELCELFAWDRKNIPRDEGERRSRFVGRVRAVLAETCVEALQPDLIVLDEFQRFKHLMGDESDASLLARKLFNYVDSHSKTQAKVLLLSATPYKMLTLASQGEEENHYEDFLDTLRFLASGGDAFPAVSAAVDKFRLALLRLRSGGAIEDVLAAKQDVERGLRSVMVRTERLAATEDRSGMLAEARIPARLEAPDAAAYVTVQKVADALGERDLVEYWKSAPYVLNYLDGYQVRDKLKAAAEDRKLAARVASVLRVNPGHFLDTASVRALDQVEVQNGRMRAILAETVERGAWRMLWMPPSLPGYRLDGAFADIDQMAFTKQLVFSSWRMVPRAVSTLVSHAAAVKAIGAFEAARGRAGSGASRWPSPLLRFQVEAGGRHTGMPLFTLLYPSIALARLDPVRVAGRPADGSLPSVEEVLLATEGKVKALLAPLRRESREDSQPDERWYWIAPLMLDLAAEPAPASSWIEQKNLAAIWEGAGEETEERAHWADHVQKFTAGTRAEAGLGAMPGDLARVLAEMAIGSPAVAALRALCRILPEQLDEALGLSVRNEAAAVAWEMRNLYNHPDAIAMLRATSAVEPYWRRALQYGVEGGLDAVLEEYVHVLVEALGLSQAAPAKVVTEVGEAIRGALGLRPGAVGADEFVRKGEDGFELRTHRLRTRFAMPFADSRPDKDEGGEGEVTRMEKVREAFNSPFWPFVLVSTSVGQEGLDFHPYCHSVVHWNLPSNPVDLEQREGRVHRYKGHAVRKNIAMVHGRAALEPGARDRWAVAFELAARARPAGATDMVPYWIFPVEGGAKIERRVPALPLSRDLMRMADLRRTLAVYRLVFGQPRQEDLIEYLTSRFSGEELARICAELRVDLSPG